MLSLLYTLPMPRQPRIDAPGLLYHVIARGLEQKPIFRDDRDRHLFQNRYKATICQEDIYLLNLIRYINQNPIKAGIVKTYEELARFRYVSHSHILGRRKADWFDPDAVLNLFGARPRSAREAYLKFITAGGQDHHHEDLDGGGLMRSLGFPDRYPKEKQAYDERVLGIGDFVEGLHDLCGEEDEQVSGITPEDILAEVSKEYSVAAGLIAGRTKIRTAVRARRVYAYRLATEAGMSGSDIARLLSVSRTTASKMIRIGASIS